MALEINATFKAFADFATQSIDAGKAKAIARAGDGGGTLAGRTITAAKGDWVGIGAGRLKSQQEANNSARILFKNAIVEMFGNEDKIPASVKNAMKLEDYGKGRPLTARRIIAVKNAIETYALGAFDKAAMDKGFAKGELPSLKKAADFFAGATRCTLAEALDEVSKPGSKAYRLMNYGGKFLESAENFKNGLKLMDSFAKWMAKTCKTLEATPRENFNSRTGVTILNARASLFHADYLRGMEKFVFEEFASGVSRDLTEQDSEKLFGMENNAPMRFFGRGLGESYTQTVANIPPERRCVFYAAMDAAFPLFTDPEIAQMTASERPDSYIAASDRSMIVGRVMKNFDKLEGLMADGKIDTEAFIKTCYPEAKTPTRESMNVLFRKWELEIQGDDDREIAPKYPIELSGSIGNLMEETGCTVEEAFAGLQKGGVLPPTPKYVSSGTLSLKAFDGTVNEARNQLSGDLVRPADYSIDGKGLLPKDAGFQFKFPDGASYKANGSQGGRAQIPAICDKVEELCGPIRREQASSTLMMLCQSGLGMLRGGLSGYGITSNEHSAVNFEISKDKETGDINIRYTSPEELPFSFEWTATIKPDGYVTTTPFAFSDGPKAQEVQMQPGANPVEDGKMIIEP